VARPAPFPHFEDPEVVAAGDRSWGGMLFFGIVSVVLGVLVGVRPRATIDGVAIILGMFLVANGLFRMVVVLADGGGPSVERVLVAAVALLSVVIGILFLRETHESVATLAFLIGLFWFVGGIIEMVSASTRTATPGRRFRMVMGGLGLVAGLVTLIVPSITLVTLVAISGVWLAAHGVLQITTALALRKLTASSG
jgi:uncharacterized membrane protein HdeD (DUF308 family)